MITERVHLLTTGREIVLDVVPVDPRDLFRGDYVRLGYPAERVSAALFTEPQGKRGTPVYVVLAQDGAGKWQPVRAQSTVPTGLAQSEVVIQATVGGQGTGTVDFGIGTYFVPENEGRKIEKEIAGKQVQIRVAVSPTGKPAIKGMLIGGLPVYTEPLL
jgi:uncharacterized membrane-anchored protein